MSSQVLQQPQRNQQKGRNSSSSNYQHQQPIPKTQAASSASTQSSHTTREHQKEESLEKQKERQMKEYVLFGINGRVLNNSILCYSFNSMQLRALQQPQFDMSLKSFLTSIEWVGGFR